MSHFTRLECEIRILQGASEVPRIAAQAYKYLVETIDGTLSLLRAHNPGIRFHNGAGDMKTSTKHCSAVGRIKTSRPLDLNGCFGDLREMIASERISRLEQGKRRKTLFDLNRVFSDPRFEGLVSLDSQVVHLRNLARADAPQLGSPWRGIAVGNVLHTRWREQALTLEVLDNRHAYRSIEVLLAGHPAFLRSATPDRPVAVVGAGTINAFRLDIALVEEVRFATDEDLVHCQLEPSLL
ncbi:hypothetical protein GCM10028862_03250 [Luteimonas pelagia]